MRKANYRKLNDHSHSSSTYHKKDGTSSRAILKKDLKETTSDIWLKELNKKPSMGLSDNDGW